MTRRPADKVTLGVEALRRLTADDGPVATVTRTRVLERVHGRGRRRLVGLASGLALLAIVSGAVAATMFVRRGPERARVPSPPNVAVHAAAKTHAAAKALPSPPPPVEVSPGAPATPAPVSAPPGGDAEMTSYGAAHAAHFARKNPAAALRLWTAYLQRYPHGRFVPEASYNRAVALIRLGRNAQALEALRPIAAGRFGDYRRHEAEVLIGALGEAGPE